MNNDRRDEVTNKINVDIPQVVANEMHYYVNRYKGTTKKQYVTEAVRNYNMLQGLIEKFRKQYPNTRYEINVRIEAIDSEHRDDEMKKAAILVY